MPFCNRCGKEIPEVATFCLHCGEPVTPVTSRTYYYPPKNIIRQPEYLSPPLPPSSQRSKRSVSITTFAATIIVLLVMTGIVSYFAFSGVGNNTAADKLRIGTTLETYYDYVRVHIRTLGGEPLAEERWNNYPNYYNVTTSVASYFAAHDAGQAYWSDMESGSGYYDQTGEHAYQTARVIIDYAMNLAGVSSSDSDVEKIDKILGFISVHVVYQSKLLDHMWFPTETLTFESGDCTSFSILASCMFERVGIKSAIGIFTNSSMGAHMMVLVHLDDLGSYRYSYYNDLTDYGLTAGKWIVIEPQYDSLSSYSSNFDWVQSWGIVAANEVIYGV